MGRLTRATGPQVAIVGALVIWLSVVIAVGASTSPRQERPAETPKAAPTAAKAAPPAPVAQAKVSADEYVGEEKCMECHEDQGKAYRGTPHGRQNLERSPAAAKGCETCHGPGKGHVDGGPDGGVDKKIINFKILMPQQASEICQTCHMRGTHALFTGSQHDQRNVGCVTCHSVHTAKGEKQLKAATQPELCATCHRNVVNKQSRFNHMPVREGKLACSSCHNPHGSANVKLLKTGTTVDEACTSCHSEKRGPYLWEHAPVVNACVTCHDPHGSNNERLLVAKVPFLCQRCHVTSRHPPTVYDGFALKNSAGANRLTGQGCVVCHAQIHGSNAPSGKYFHR